MSGKNVLPAHTSAAAKVQDLLDKVQRAKENMKQIDCPNIPQHQKKCYFPFLWKTIEEFKVKFKIKPSAEKVLSPEPTSRPDVCETMPTLKRKRETNEQHSLQMKKKHKLHQWNGENFSQPQKRKFTYSLEEAPTTKRMRKI